MLDISYMKLRVWTLTATDRRSQLECKSHLRKIWKNARSETTPDNGDKTYLESINRSLYLLVDTENMVSTISKSAAQKRGLMYSPKRHLILQLLLQNTVQKFAIFNSDSSVN